jgi:hypothetical protein
MNAVVTILLLSAPFLILAALIAVLIIVIGNRTSRPAK